MPDFRYSFVGYDPLTHVRASGREVDVSPKAAREVCTAIKEMTIAEAKEFLESVIMKKRAIAFRRYKKEVAHRSSLFKFHAGGYPVKAAEEVLEVVKNLEANASFKGMDAERVVIEHASAMGGRKIKAYVPRAFGRSSPSFHTLVHIELVGREV